MKKISFLLAVFLFISTAFSGCSGGETAESDSSSNTPTTPVTDFVYKIDKEKACIIIEQYIGKDAEVVIPEKIEKLPVKEIGFCAFYKSNLKSVTIPKTVELIEAYAFSECQNLTEVNFGSGVTTIEGYAFENCSSLKKLVLPPNLEVIKTWAVSNCVALEYVFIPKNAACMQCFVGNPALKTIEFKEGSTFIGAYGMVVNCPALKEITIPAGVNRLIEYSFQECENLKKITFLGDAPTDIGNNVFGKPNKDIKIYYNKNTSGWENCPLAEKYTLVAQ